MPNVSKGNVSVGKAMRWRNIDVLVGYLNVPKLFIKLKNPKIWQNSKISQIYSSTKIPIFSRLCKFSDVNECEWEKCEPNALCVNTDGSFHCECKIGYAGSGNNCTKEPSTKIRKNKGRLAVCGQNFDKRYENKCHRNTSWEIRYFYDQHNRQCRRFWYGGCQYAESQNIFADAQVNPEKIKSHFSNLIK